MERLYTSIIGMPVVEDDSHHPITTVKDVVLDPENGKLLALIVNSGKNMVIVPHDILFWGDRVQINNYESIINANEVLRVDAVLKKGFKLYNARVETLDQRYLGDVLDFSLDSHSFVLKRLFVAKDIMGLVRYGNRIISVKDIVNIHPRKVIVRADLEMVKEKEVAQVEDLAIS